MGAMVVSARCPLLGAGLASAVTSRRFSSRCSSPVSAPRPRVVRIRASSSSRPVESSTASSSSAPVESSAPATLSTPPVESSAAATSSSPPVESSAAATSSAPSVESSAASTSSTAAETLPEAEAEAETGAEAEAETESGPESASIDTLDIPPPPPATSKSLVSRTPELVLPEGAAGLAQVNHYTILNVPYGSSSDEIFKAYRDRVAEVTSQGSELAEEAARDQLGALQESYDILSSEQQRKIYDWVLQRYENRSRDSYIWPYQTDITQRYTNKEPPPVMRSFDKEGNNRVGLFLIGWVIISIIFGVTMKTWVPYPHYRDL